MKRRRQFEGFYGPGWLWLGAKRSRGILSACAILKAQSTHRGARPGSKLATRVPAGPLRAPQPRARERPAARRQERVGVPKIAFHRSYTHQLPLRDVAGLKSPGCRKLKRENTADLYICLLYTSPSPRD